MNYRPRQMVARSGSSPRRHIPRSSNVLLRRAVGGDDVQPGAVRAIEYEIMDKEQATRNGLTGTSLEAGELQAMPELGVLRCVDHQGKKVTLVGHAAHVRNLVASGKASDPSGMTPNEQSFRVVVNGWIISR
jgi:hypothetical protein